MCAYAASRLHSRTPPASPTGLPYPSCAPPCVAHCSYDDRIVDGFYEVHGEFPEACPPAEFPQLSALMQVVPKPEAGNMRREVILIDRAHDRHLAAMHKEAADAVYRARAGSTCGSANSRDAAEGCASPCSPGSPGGQRAGCDSLSCFQALAHVVAGHMGGSLVRRRPLPAPLSQSCGLAPLAHLAPPRPPHPPARHMAHLPACRRTRSRRRRSSGLR